MEKKIKVGTIFQSKLDKFKVVCFCPICKKRVMHKSHGYYYQGESKSLEEELQKHISTDKACIRQQKLNELLD